ncbi:hypothetical protein KUF83_28755 [Streptomyces sp. BV286]|uniref:hypothetical protein n=1 Tax=Streptomyces sp. BV286 TaxID=2849672 RepID=UPI001C2E8869|nr:hypothetical protein [Streptomyces sp. BV286]MBV1940531.1 hypothetical protein [Streptomyces sp. BV286]
MTLWFKVRRVQGLLVPAVVFFVVIVAVAHDQYVRLPGLLSAGGNRVFLMQLTPLIITSALAHSLAQGVPEIEATGQRKIRVMDAGLVTASVAIVALTSVVAGSLAGSQEATMAGRNTLFLAGLMLLARAVHEQAASALPVGWVFAVMFIGYRDFHRPWPWAVTLHPSSFLPTLGLCLLVFVAGLAVHARTRRF